MIDGLLSAVHSLQENQEDHLGSKPGMGSISGHDRSTFNSGILRQAYGDVYLAYKARTPRFL